VLSSSFIQHIFWSANAGSLTNAYQYLLSSDGTRDLSPMNDGVVEKQPALWRLKKAGERKKESLIGIDLDLRIIFLIPTNFFVVSSNSSAESSPPSAFLFSLHLSSSLTVLRHLIWDLDFYLVAVLRNETLVEISSGNRGIGPLPFSPRP
jgi:hypothetical protein